MAVSVRLASCPFFVLKSLKRLLVLGNKTLVNLPVILCNIHYMETTFHTGKFFLRERACEQGPQNKAKKAVNLVVKDKRETCKNETVYTMLVHVIMK